MAGTSPTGLIASAVGGGVIGGAVVNLVLNETGFVGQLGAAESQFKGSVASMSASGTTAATGIGGAFARMSTVTQIGLAVAGAALVKFALGSVQAFEQAQQVTAATQAVIKSTGGTANVTAGQVIALSQTIRDYSGASDTAVQASENMLLTFTKVRNEAGAGNDIFTQATGTIVDMATAINHGAVPSMEQLNTATKAVGKALNDPVVGMTSLRRITGAFTATQVDMIKQLAASGHLLQAQKMIIDGLQKAYGGAAKAAGDTLGGQIAVLSSQFKDLEAAVGQGIAPVLGAFAKALSVVMPLLTPIARNLYLVVAAFGALLAMSALPELLVGIAGGLEAIGAAKAANGIGSLAAGLSAITGPEIIGGLGDLYATIGLIQRVTGNKPIFDIGKQQEIASAISAIARQANLLPGPLEAIKSTIQAANPQFKAAAPLLEQMGQNTRDFAAAASAAASKGQAAFQKFADETLVKAADAIQKWRTETAASLDFVDNALGSFAGKTQVSTDKIIRSFQTAAAQQKQFGSDIQTIMKRGGTDANGLAKQLISMGQDGVAAAHAIASAHQKAFNSIVQGYAKGQQAADSLARSIQGPLIGTLRNIQSILTAIARKWGVTIDVNNKQANAAVGSTQRALDAVPTKITSVITASANQAIAAAHAATAALNAVPNTVTSVITTVSRHVTTAAGHMAIGGITHGPAYMVGEGGYSTFAGRGAEAVIPLNDRGIGILSKALHKAGGGPNINVTINTQGNFDENTLAASVSRHLARTIREEALV